jgi:hypothetical protein
MAKCHDNRKARKRRDKKQLERAAHHHFDAKALSADGGKNPNYYAVVYPSVPTKLVGHARVIDIRKLRFKVVPNKTYRDTVAQLLKMCKGVTVDLSAIRRAEEEA